MFADCRDAVLATGAVASVAMAPPLETLAAVEEALAAGIRLIVTVAEGIPLHDAMRIGRAVRHAGATWIGASTPGMAIPGEMKLGFLPDVCLRPGPFAIMTKSGTLSYEVGYRLARAGLGQSIWVGVGGDPVKGVRFADLLPVFFADARTQAIILVGEVGGSEEEECADALLRLGVRKPRLCADRRTRGEGGRLDGPRRCAGAWARPARSPRRRSVSVRPARGCSVRSKRSWQRASGIWPHCAPERADGVLLSSRNSADATVTQLPGLLREPLHLAMSRCQMVRARIWNRC